MKKQEHIQVKKHTKECPGEVIGIKTFASHLNEAFLAFYKPQTIISSFEASGIFLVNRNAIRNDALEPRKTFHSTTESNHETDQGIASSSNNTDAADSSSSSTDVPDGAKIAFDAYKSVLDTPTKHRYTNQINDNTFNTSAQSPNFRVFKKLHQKADITHLIYTTLC